LADPEAAAAPLPDAVRVVQHSSHDRQGGNFDGGTYDGPLGPIGQPPTYLRRDEHGTVLFGERRPGCLVRMWFTGFSPSTGRVDAFGRIQLLFDGEPTPRVDVDATEFFAGRLPGYPQPLVADAVSSSGGVDGSRSPSIYGSAVGARPRRRRGRGGVVDAAVGPGEAVAVR
jgi:hypothetical protein